jgi:hypothetical protein
MTPDRAAQLGITLVIITAWLAVLFAAAWHREFSRRAAEQEALDRRAAREAARAAAARAEAMPPRPQLRRPPPPITGGVPMSPGGPLNPQYDPCGAPPVKSAAREKVA